MTGTMLPSVAAIGLRATRLAVCATVLALTLSGLLAWASDGGTLLGTVTDPHNAVVAGATVTATVPTTGMKRSVVTDGQGFYSFQNLGVGTYDVRSRRPGSSLSAAPAS